MKKYHKAITKLLFIFVFTFLPAYSFAATYTNFNDIKQLYPEIPHDFLNLELVSKSADLIKDGGEAALRFRITFDITALEEDVYIPLSARKSSDEFFGGFGYNIYSESRSPFTTFERLNTSIETTAQIINEHAYIPAGETEEFSTEIIAVPFYKELDEGKKYSLEFNTIYLVLKKTEFYKDRVYSNFLAKSGFGPRDSATPYVAYSSNMTGEVDYVSEEVEESTEEHISGDEEKRKLLEKIKDLLTLVIELRKQLLNMQSM